MIPGRSTYDAGPSSLWACWTSGRVRISVSDVSRKKVAMPASTGSAIAEPSPKAPASLLLPKASKSAAALLVLMMISGNLSSTFSLNLLILRRPLSLPRYNVF